MTATEVKTLNINARTHAAVRRIAERRKWSLKTTVAEAVKCLEKELSQSSKNVSAVAGADVAGKPSSAPA